MAEIETATPDPYITEQLGELHEANQKGLITCLVMIVFRADGTSNRMIHGKADTVRLIGSIELLKGFVVGDEYRGLIEQEREEAERERLN